MTGLHLLAQSGNLTDGLPLQDIGFAGLLGIVVWWLVRRADRDDTAQASEMSRLRETLDSERLRHTELIAAESEAWRAEIAKTRESLTELIEAERQLTQAKSAEKHTLGNQLQKATGLLYTILAMSDACTCGALKPVQPVIDRWQAEHRPLSDGL